MSKTRGPGVDSAPGMSATAFLVPGDSQLFTVDKPVYWSMALLPLLWSRLDDLLIAYDLNISRFDGRLDLDSVLLAITSMWARPGKPLSTSERMEWWGDTRLLLPSAMDGCLRICEDTCHGGLLVEEQLRKQQQNWRLRQLVVDVARCSEYLRAVPFEPEEWEPSGVSTKSSITRVQINEKASSGSYRRRTEHP